MKKLYEVECGWLGATGERYAAVSSEEALRMFARAHVLGVRGFEVVDTWEEDAEDAESGCGQFRGQEWADGDYMMEMVTVAAVKAERAWR
jgi:hypothetical protein